MKIEPILLVGCLITACASQPVALESTSQPASQENIAVKYEVKDCAINYRVTGPFQPIACKPKKPDGVAFLYSLIIEVDGSVSNPKILCASPVNLDLSHMLEVVSHWEIPIDKRSGKRRKMLQCVQISKQAFTELMVGEYAEQ